MDRLQVLRYIHPGDSHSPIHDILHSDHPKHRSSTLHLFSNYHRDKTISSSLHIFHSSRTCPSAPLFHRGSSISIPQPAYPYHRPPQRVISVSYTHLTLPTNRE